MQSEAIYAYRTVAVDEEGFLLDASDWTRDMAPAIAASMDIDLTEQHWQVIDYIRGYFESNHAVPELRTFLKYLRDSKDKDNATRKYVYRLFPYGYGQQACKIAGMRKPRKLMLDV